MNSAGPSTGAYIAARVPITQRTVPDATARYARYRSAGAREAFSTATSPSYPPFAAPVRSNIRSPNPVSSRDRSFTSRIVGSTMTTALPADIAVSAIQPAR